jgi:hypothetical protein
MVGKESVAGKMRGKKYARKKNGVYELAGKMAGLNRRE